MSLPALSPGTVSKILWHFTGGPQWSQKLRKQKLRPKPPKQAYKALKKILSSKTLRVGGYREIIRKQTPRKRRRKPYGPPHRTGKPPGLVGKGPTRRKTTSGRSWDHFPSQPAQQVIDPLRVALYVAPPRVLASGRVPRVTEKAEDDLA